MKKLKHSIIAVVLVFSLLTGVFSINSVALQPGPDCEKVSHHFFEEIGNSVPANVRGSCVYVALTMMLQFYDFYWNDDFVDDSYYDGGLISCNTDNYPSAVPKILLENYILPENESEYPNFVRENYMDYLHLYLLYLASSVVRGENDQPLINFDDESYGINIFETQDLLEFYLKNVAGFSREQVVVHVVTSSGEITAESEIYQLIAEKVESGIPVYYSGGTDDSSHAMIAYKMTDGGDDIDMSTGYTDSCFPIETYIDNNDASPGDESHTTVLTTKYKNDVKIMWIEITDGCPHKCSNRYLWYPTNTPVCSCVAYKNMHPAHTHSAIELGDSDLQTSTTHTYLCYCGELLVSSHGDYTYHSISDYKHARTCSCGYVTQNSHILEYTKDDSTHTKTCIYCGYAKNECHTMSYSSLSNTMHSRTCFCGYSIAEQHNFVRQSAQYSRCTDCGYLRDHFGGNENVHLGVEEELDGETE